MMNILTLFGVMLFVSPAFAQTMVVPPECRLLPEHRPSPDVAYQSGVDTKGKSVVPADINAAPIDIANQTIVVPLTIDLAERMRGQPAEGLQLEGNLGYLEIQPDGRVSHNGQDWTSQVYVLCGKQGVMPDGQSSEDVIKYGAEPQAANNPAGETK